MLPAFFRSSRALPRLSALSVGLSLAALTGTALEKEVAAFLERSTQLSQATGATRAALATLLESPNYQLC